MLAVIVLIAAGVLTSSAACASPDRKVTGRPSPASRRRKPNAHLTKACAAVLALAAVTLAIHLQLGASA